MTQEEVLRARERMKALAEEDRQQKIKESQRKIKEADEMPSFDRDSHEEIPMAANTTSSYQEPQPIKNEFKILVFLHGSLNGSYPIQKYPTDKVITLSGLGKTCYITPECDQGLIDIYLGSKSIYNNDDKDYTLTTDGSIIQDSCRFEFKNHINENYINNVFLSTRGEAPGAAKIVVLIKVRDNYTKLKEIIPDTDWDLKTLFNYCSREFEGERTYILRTCRVWPKFTEKEHLKLYQDITRTVSDNTYSGYVDVTTGKEEKHKLETHPPTITDFSSSSKKTKTKRTSGKSFEQLLRKQRGFLDRKPSSSSSKTQKNTKNTKNTKIYTI